MKAAAAIAEVLRTEGTEYLFGFPVNPLIDECARIGIRPIVARTERTLVNMTDGRDWEKAASSQSYRCHFPKKHAQSNR
jgi:thiamine pyrophosphate-dependent acetolactate synthase large subunit-like protein